MAGDDWRLDDDFVREARYVEQSAIERQRLVHAGTRRRRPRRRGKSWPVLLLGVVAVSIWLVDA